MRSFYFVVKMAYFLPLSRKIGWSVSLDTILRQFFLAEHGKYNFLTTKKCYENS